ncbi:DUF533 domain-containing protein [Oscillatoria sp. CS-180]|uniref:DUF533 domain-containing protein n=1 Tax=Oscillatoria sp. CS-180 TaxID=3021720 RepID=UPI002FEE043E
MLRITATMAWADGSFDSAEQSLILDQLSRKFAHTPEEQAPLKEELSNLLAKKIPLEELVPQLTSDAQREQTLLLSYEVIRSNGINKAEAASYQQLVSLLNLPPDIVNRLEATTVETF